MGRGDKGREWYEVGTSDPEGVKGLIMLRNQYDLLYGFEDDEIDANSTGIQFTEQLEDITCTYVELDKVIAETTLSEIQESVMVRIMMGYEIEDVASEDETTIENVEKVLDNVCKKISEEGLRQWRKWTYVHKLGLKTVRCSRCEEDLPGTEEFFGSDDRNKTGFQSICKKCDTIRKKSTITGKVVPTETKKRY